MKENEQKKTQLDDSRLAKIGVPFEDRCKKNPESGRLWTVARSSHLDLS